MKKNCSKFNFNKLCNHFKMENVSRGSSQSWWISCQKITIKSTMKFTKKNKKTGKLASVLLTRHHREQRLDKMNYHFAQKSGT